MKKTEIVKLFALIRSEYSTFENTNEKKLLWHELMVDLSFETAIENVKRHMAKSSYPPTAADVIKKELGKDDLEIRLRNQEIAFQNYVRAGGDPNGPIIFGLDVRDGTRKLST